MILILIPKFLHHPAAKINVNFSHFSLAKIMPKSHHQNEYSRPRPFTKKMLTFRKIWRVRASSSSTTIFSEGTSRHSSTTTKICQVFFAAMCKIFLDFIGHFGAGAPYSTVPKRFCQVLFTQKVQNYQKSSLWCGRADCTVSNRFCQVLFRAIVPNF